MKRLAISAAMLGLSAGCAAAPRPSVLAQLDGVRASAAAQDAKQLAPQQHAHGERLRLDAERALDDGDRAGAQLLGEHAIAAHSRGFVLARLARAEQRLGEARARVASSEAELARVDEQQSRTAAEAEAVETRLRVARDALPLVPNAPAGPEREKARLAAARALAVQARLLCVATQLVAPAAPGLADDLGALDRLDATLAGEPEATPIDAALGLRSSCLGRLTAARRPATSASPAAGAADALLAELSRAGDRPSRDDRGVVVTLRGIFGRGAALTAKGKQTLERLARIAQAQGVPLLVVVHGSGKAGHAGKPGESVAGVLGQAGAARVEVRSAGSALPIADPASASAAARNDRVEIVFVVSAS